MNNLIIYSDKALYKENLNSIQLEGDKFKAIKKYHETIGLEFDNIIMIDYDVIVTAEQLEGLFELINRYGLVYPSFEETKDNLSEIRLTTKGDISCIGMSRDNFNKLVSTFDEPESGLSDLWYYILKEPYCISDLITVKRAFKREFNENDYKEVKEKYKFEHENKVLGHKKRNNISFVTIYSDDRRGELPEMILSLPKGSEIVLLETIHKKGIEENTDILDIEKKDNIIQGKWHYDKFNYSQARNVAKKLATKGVIFSIDSDERLNPIQHDAIIEECALLEHSKYYGLLTFTFSPSLYRVDSDKRYIGAVNGRVNIFKNIKELYWQGAIHETIDERIKELNGAYKPTLIAIYHFGYNYPIAEMIEKHKQRIEIAYNYPEDLRKKHNQFMLNREIIILNELEKI